VPFVPLNSQPHLTAFAAFEKISKKFDKKFRKATQAHFLADLALRPISSQRNVFKDLHARVGERLVGLRAQANQVSHSSSLS
jgi:hypothetical protein